MSDFDSLSPREFLIVKGARMHNLKNIDIAIPRNKLVVVTGVSGSGKSSLVFDTIYAEGQRRYVESLSAYARQFMGKLNKPEVDYIKGIAPATAIEQKVNTRNPRSTVGTSTEIYDYLKLLFARVGRTYSPISGVEVKAETVTDVVDFILSFSDETKAIIYNKIKKTEGKTFSQEIQGIQQRGYTRLLVSNEARLIDDMMDDGSLKTIEGIQKKNKSKSLFYNDIFLLIDRVTVKKEEEDNTNRISDSVQTAFAEGDGYCFVRVFAEENKIIERNFNNKFEADGLQFEIPSVQFFSFNNPYGACQTCQGFGSVLGIDENLVIPDTNKSVFDDAVAPWRGNVLSSWKDQVIRGANKTDFPIHRSYSELNEAEKELLWKGCKHFGGINDFFAEVESQLYKIQYRVLLSRFRGRKVCPDCRGSRLRKDAQYVKLKETQAKNIDSLKSITDIVLMSVDKAWDYFKNIRLNENETHIASRILTEVTNRLSFLHDVGLGYLNLNRLSNSLSGGESQRINLATSLGSSLVGSLYILDEPSIGLHPRDTQRLLGVLVKLRNLGNTVIVVEHEEDIMRAADQLIDIGPLAGVGGGHLVAQGTPKELLKNNTSLTARYLNGTEKIPVPKTRRKWNNFIEVLGAKENNLKNINVKFPLHTLTVVTGVSGSGKTSLVRTILYPAIKKELEGMAPDTVGKYTALNGDVKTITQIEMVDQNPIGKSSRSNPVTYVKAYDAIRSLYSEQPAARARSYTPAHFSFNVDGGRCDNCKGEGEITVEMQFMADVHLRCDDCKGKRFKPEILDVTYNDKNIFEVLSMTIDEAIEFFEGEKTIINRIKPLQDVGLGYVQLGQSSNTLSGGEAQRIKLASFLGKGANTSEHVLFIFDEPTTGLHFHDVNKLLASFNGLINQGHSIIVIEHNMDIIKSADWTIDLGREGGDAGGNLVFEGTPEGLAECAESYTAPYLKARLG